MIQPEFTTEELATEEWRDVVGFERFYQVSNLGRVRRLHHDKKKRTAPFRLLKMGPARGGYHKVVLSVRQVHTTKTVHSIVAAAFIGPRPEGKEPNHIDFVRSNNRALNLEYLTRQENNLHSLGNRLRGERHPNSAITNDLAKQIKSAEGSARMVAERLNVSANVVQAIRSGRHWRHV